MLLLTYILLLQSPAAADVWTQRAALVANRFYQVYTPGWEGANGAIGDAFRYRATNEASILDRYRYQFDMKRMNNGTWVDDRAWICLAELYWYQFSGKKYPEWVEDAKKRYMDARAEGRLTAPEGYWSWYNYPPQWDTGERCFTNSNMNQMVTVACELFLATGDRRFLTDAETVWNGNAQFPGIEKTFYSGKGIWKGKGGAAAFGKQLPWESASYLSVLAALYRATNQEHYRTIAIASAKHIIAEKTQWLDPKDKYQIHMDGNGAFVHYLLDAYSIAPKELKEIPGIVERMLTHVWTNNGGKATVTLHREMDHAIRNGWNPHGGEDGYGVDEVGTVHAQSQALRAFGVFSYYQTKTK